MSIHDGFLDLASAAIDFELDEYELGELDRHLAGCEACRRTAAAFRDDAAAIAGEARPRLPPGRSVAILADTLRPPQRSSSLRGPAVISLALLVVAGLIAAGIVYVRSSPGQLAAGASPDPSGSAGSSVAPTTRPTVRAGLSPQSPAGTPRPAPLSAGALPVRGPAQELGQQIRMASAVGGDLFVSLPGAGESVLVALVDPAGRVRAGWPIVLERTTTCDQLLAVEDGSVRLLCTLANGDGNPAGVVRVHALDSQGTSLAGWPIDLDQYGADGFYAARVIGDELTVLAWESLGDQIAEGQPAGNAWILAVEADGTVGAGAKVSYGIDCCIDTWAVGPDGAAYGTIHHFADTRAAARSELVAVGTTGVPAGFPVTIAGSASRPAFDAAGRIHLTVGTPNEPPSGTLVFDAAGQTVDAGSGALDIAATSEFVGIEGTGDVPAPPLVSPDGTTYVVDLADGRTTVAGLAPSGEEMAGWPYRYAVGLQGTGFCPSDAVCEGSSWAAPAVGPDNVLYLLQAAATSSAGASIVAVGRDGVVVDGWPVGLKRVGAEAWSVVVTPDGSAAVLAVEPEPNGSHSATILTLAPDSSVRYTLTIVEP